MLDALGDSMRRSILERLLDGPLAVGTLAEQLPISRPAVSQHLRALKEAELVIDSVAGTRHLYRINPSGFEVVRDYFDRFWATTLGGFATLAQAEAAKEAAARRPNRPSASPAQPAREGPPKRQES